MDSIKVKNRNIVSTINSYQNMYRKTPTYKNKENLFIDRHRKDLKDRIPIQFKTLSDGLEKASPTWENMTVVTPFV